MLPLVSRKDYEKADIKVSDTSAIDLTQNLQYTTLSKDEYTTSISSSSWSNPTNIYLQKSNGDYIKVDDIVTKNDLTSTKYLWEHLFFAMCDENPKKRKEYLLVLKLYNEDYKQTVLAIETSN